MSFVLSPPLTSNWSQHMAAPPSAEFHMSIKHSGFCNLVKMDGIMKDLNRLKHTVSIHPIMGLLILYLDFFSYCQSKRHPKSFDCPSSSPEIYS